MGTDTTAPLEPWQRIDDSDYLSPKMLIWATLLRRACDQLEEVERHLNDIPGAPTAREAGRCLSEAWQLVGLCEEQIAPHSVFLIGRQPGPRELYPES